MRLLCLLNLHKWKPLHYKSLESITKQGYYNTKVIDQRLTREYCIRCGEIRNLIEFKGVILWKSHLKEGE